MQLPVTFTVGARVELWNGGARLTIAPGVIVLEPGRVLRFLTSVKRIVHTNPEVKLIRTRLVPPWMNTTLMVYGEGGAGAATTWVFARDRLRDALRAAGFDVDEVPTWFSMGGREARKRGLPPPPPSA